MTADTYAKRAGATDHGKCITRPAGTLFTEEGLIAKSR